MVETLLQLLQNVLIFLTYHLSLSRESCIGARVDSRILNVLENNQRSVEDGPNPNGYLQQMLATLFQSIQESSTQIIHALITANAMHPDSDMVGFLGKLLPTNRGAVVPLLIAYCSSVERKTELGNSQCIMTFACGTFESRILQMTMLPCLQLLHLMCDHHPGNQEKLADCGIAYNLCRIFESECGNTMPSCFMPIKETILRILEPILNIPSAQDTEPVAPISGRIELHAVRVH